MVMRDQWHQSNRVKALVEDIEATRPNMDPFVCASATDVWGSAFQGRRGRNCRDANVGVLVELHNDTPCRRIGMSTRPGCAQKLIQGKGRSNSPVIHMVHPQHLR